MSLQIKFIQLLDNYISFQVFPNDFEVSTNNLIVKHLFDLDNTYSIYKDTEPGTYKIQFIRYINLSDFFIIYLKDNYIISNTINISVCRSVLDGSTVFPFDTSHLSSGEYSLSLSSLNDIQLDNITSRFIICDGLDLTNSSISPTKYPYSTTEDVSLKVKLFDSKGLPAPNGDYIVKITIENK